MSVMQNDLESLTDAEVVERASNRIGSHRSWVAIDELTRRALEKQDLLDAAIKAISTDRAMKPHYVPYGSYLAVGRILNSGNGHAIRCLLKETDGWSKYEQVDAIRPWAGYKQLMEGTQILRDTYGWSPKYDRDM